MHKHHEGIPISESKPKSSAFKILQDSSAAGACDSSKLKPQTAHLGFSMNRRFVATNRFQWGRNRLCSRLHMQRHRGHLIKKAVEKTVENGWHLIDQNPNGLQQKKWSSKKRVAWWCRWLTVNSAFILLTYWEAPLLLSAPLYTAKGLKKGFATRSC